MTSKPTHHVEKRIASQGGETGDRLAAALCAAAVEPTRPAQGSLAARRRRAAAGAARSVLFDIASTPAVRDGQRLDDDDLERLVADHLKGESFPKGVTDSLRPLAVGIIKLAAAGERHRARDAARAAAVEVGEALAKSKWSQTADEWDPTSAIGRIRRV